MSVASILCLLKEIFSIDLNVVIFMVEEKCRRKPNLQMRKDNIPGSLGAFDKY